MSTVFGPWKIKSEKQRGLSKLSILRYVQLEDGTETSERLPVEKYQTIRDNPEDLQKLIDRMNYDANKAKLARQKVAFKHAFIDDELIEEFRSLLLAQIPSKDRVSTSVHYLKKHFLNFFIHNLGLANPREWYQVHQTKWAEYLTSPKAPAAPATKREVIQIANRFMVWLHSRRPDEVPLIKFAPLSLSVLKKMEADRKMNKEGADRKSITDEHWTIIKEALPAQIKPQAYLAFHYGLRRAEVLGLKRADVKKGYLYVERQLLSIRPELKFGPLKGREARRVPHWMTSPTETHKWISDANANVMHPDTLSDRWLEAMGKLGLDYDFHDLRHSFITRMIRAQAPRDVQLAAGHKNLETTMGYSHDDRKLDDEEFSPGDAA